MNGLNYINISFFFTSLNNKYLQKGDYSCADESDRINGDKGL